MLESRLLSSFPNYRLEDRSVEIAEIPSWVWGLMILLLLVPMLVYFSIWGFATMKGIEWRWLYYSLVFLVLHELTHAITWKLTSKLPWNAFSFGIQWKTVTPYCHSNKPMSVVAYRIGAFMPLIVTGLLPWLVSLIGGFPELALASSLLISGAGGDIYIIWSIRDLPPEVLVQDHDSRAGCLVLWPE